MSRAVQMVVNRAVHELSLEPERSLLSVLREELGLTGAKPGCGEGVCGACTVLVDGEPVRSCITPAVDVADRAVTTVEGLARDGLMHPVQRAFVEERAMQCGYCTSGMILGLASLLEKSPDPDETLIRESLAGNICRCCTYPRIVRAARRAAELASSDDDGVVTEPRAATPELPAPGRGPWDLLALEERDYFDVLSDGMVVVLSDEQGADGGWSTSNGAWIHVGADGLVTAFTGKVDVGQDNRTALSQLVAEELRVRFDRVRLVMGDTDLCPYDMGTFGSRSMPDAGENLRATAASARELLLTTAAKMWAVDADGLFASDAAVRERDGERTIAYGDLLLGDRRVERAVDVHASPETGWRTAGTPIPKVTAAAIATGAQRYPTDLSRPGMLRGRVIRPPAVGATMRSLDAAGAHAMPDVSVVHEDDFVGVVAPDTITARRGIDAIRAEWDRFRSPRKTS